MTKKKTVKVNCSLVDCKMRKYTNIVIELDGEKMTLKSNQMGNYNRIIKEGEAEYYEYDFVADKRRA